MKKKIAYIELDTHSEIAINFMELMENSTEFDVDYYFSEKILKNISNKNQNIYTSSSKTIENQLKTTHYDLVIIGTCHRFFNTFYQITRQYNTAIILHNLNFTKLSTLQLLTNIFKKDIIYRLKLLIKEGLLKHSQLFQGKSHFFVLDKALKSEKHQHLPIFYNKFLSVSSKKSIVIPGAVSQKRRDYKKVLSLLKNFKENWEVIFLGKASGEEVNWLLDFEKNKPQNIQLEYFTDKIPQEIFDYKIKNTSILWCPIQTKTEFFSNVETYGTTKITGNIGDAIKYGKQAIFPKNYPSEYPFIIPEKEDIEAQILSLIQNNDIDFSPFSKENISRELHTEIRKYILQNH